MHECTPGRANPPGRRISAVSSVQCFSNSNTGSSARKFTVHVPPPSEPPISILAQYQQQHVSRPQLPVQISLPDNHRILNQFLNKEGWIQHIEGLPAARLVNLYQITLKDMQFPKLARHIEWYLLNIQSNLNSYHARRLISTRPSTE